MGILLIGIVIIVLACAFNKNYIAKANVKVGAARAKAKADGGYRV